jgi:hypothetical protein
MDSLREYLDDTKLVSDCFVELVELVERTNRRLINDPNTNTGTLLQMEQLTIATMALVEKARQHFRTSPEIINQGLDIPDNGD